MGCDACFRSGFHPDGAFFHSRKEQEIKKNCYKVHLGRLSLATRSENCPSEYTAVLPELTQFVVSDKTLVLSFKEQLVRVDETLVK